MQRSILGLTIGVFVLVLALLVWPSIYIYGNDNDGHVYRVNRFTGHMQDATQYGWMSTEGINLRHLAISAKSGDVKSANDGPRYLTVTFNSGGAMVFEDDERSQAYQVLKLANVPIGAALGQ